MELCCNIVLVADMLCSKTNASIVVSWVEAWSNCGLLFGFFRNQSW